VPNFLDTQSAKAVDLIRSLDLRVNRVSYFTPTGDFAFGIKRVASDEPAGTILRQHPSPGKKVEPGTQITLVASAGPRPACDPSYAGVCIPPYPPDLDCDDVPYSDIAVVGSDPHGFDGYDNDGRGCES
jgi:beta-lactam-binding protein with PASTA domain